MAGCLGENRALLGVKLLGASPSFACSLVEVDELNRETSPEALRFIVFVTEYEYHIYIYAII